MKEFLLIFRMDILTPEAQPTQEQMNVYMQDWMQWINSIADNGKLAEGGNHLAYYGKVLRPGNVVENTPYVANNESVAGYIIVNAKDIDDAVSLARKCPIIQGKGTSVEVREVAAG